MMYHNYFLFGLQRSGTNYFNQLMRDNFKSQHINVVPSTNPIWKHSIYNPHEFIGNTPTVVIYKNPYMWIETLCFRKKMDWNETQTGFNAEKGPKDHLTGSGINVMNVETLSKAYLAWYKSWVEPFNAHIFVLKYEDLLEKSSLKNTMNLISNKFTFQKIKTHIQDVKKGSVFLSEDYNEKRHKRYRSGKTLHLESKYKKVITQTIGGDIIQKIGYKIQN